MRSTCFVAATCLTLTAVACQDDSPVVTAATFHGVPASVLDTTSSPAYDLVDLGPGVPGGINELGQVAASACTDSGCQAYVWYQGVTTLIGQPGGDTTLATGINARGQVIGETRQADGTWRLFLWTAGVAIDLGPATRPSLSLGGLIGYLRGGAVNDNGDVAWTAPAGNGRTHAMLWSGGAAQDLTPAIDGSATAGDISSTGVVAGSTTMPGDSAHAVMWDHGSTRDLGVGTVVGVTRGGQVLFNHTSWATIDDRRDIYSAVMWWDGAQVGMLPRFDGYRNAQATAMTDAGVAVINTFGSVGDPELATPYSWTPGAPVPADASGSGAAAYGAAISADGSVLAGNSPRGGAHDLGIQHVVVWQDGTRFDLGTLDPASPFSWSLPLAVNSRGVVVGASNGHAVVWEKHVTSVAIDIRPGVASNSVNLKSGGRIPVAVLTTPTFDATSVDQSTVVFAGAPAIAGAGRTRDVNGDGLRDIVFTFSTQALTLTRTDTLACLSAMASASPVRGCDTVRVK